MLGRWVLGRRAYLGAIAAGLGATAGCVRSGGDSDVVVDETVADASFLGFSAVAEEPIELTVETLSGEHTVVDLVDSEGEVLVGGAEVTDERTFAHEARNTGSHEVFVDPAGRAAVTVRVG